ncbi:MAG: hypothetical protein KDD11_09650 [Acidobacteria bacterium]|nr:hypothetical protein [Acidobacteriota bacterium]
MYKHRSVRPWVLLLGLATLAPDYAAAQAGDSSGATLNREVPRPPQRAQSKEKDVDPVVLRRGYLDSLEKLVTLGREQAVEALGELEDAYVEPAMRADSGLLWKVQGQVAAELSRKNPEVLVPIMMLHHDAAGFFQQRRVWFLASRSRLQAAALADAYAKASGSEGARVVAGRTYASLGAYLQQINTTRECRCTPLYRDALSYDPANEVALLGMGTVFEKAGDPIAAVAVLRRLVKAQPRQREAALRLAINEARGGWRKDAEERLRGLTRADGPEWVVAVAYQELARLYLDRGDRSSALAVVDEGRTRLPGNEALALLDAFLLERDRKLKEASEVLEAVRIQGEHQAAEARARYNHWPAPATKELRQELWQGAESRLPMLADSLGLEPDKVAGAGSSNASSAGEPTEAGVVAGAL